MLKKLTEFSKKKKSITNDELAELLGYPDDLRGRIRKLADDGLISPVKSSVTDGNISSPIYKKYKIILPSEDMSDVLAEINRLHPKLIANGYLRRKPNEYIKNKQLIGKLNTYISGGHDNVKMSRRERSLVIFGEEKVLDNNISLIRSLGFTEDELGYYVTPEQCFCDYIPRRKSSMILLICENKDIWFNIRRLMFEKGYNELFGQHIDGVIYGQGNDITGKDKFNAYAKYLGEDNISFLYCGDIDRAGFDIFFRLKKEASALDVRLFCGIYRAMLDLCNIDTLPDSDDNRDITVDTDGIRELFDDKYYCMINRIFTLKKRLPQEIINMKILSENMKAVKQ